MWDIRIHKKALKQYKELPKGIQDRVNALLLSLRATGAVQGTFSNYGKLSETKHHCHIKKGQPTYVVVWEEVDKTIKIIEVIYVGTHENAPY